MRKQLFLLTAIASAVATTAFGQIKVKTESGDLTVRFAGRTNVDLGTYLTDKDVVSAEDDDIRRGIVMSDTRLGIVADFDNTWSAKIEVCYNKKAISFRDLWVGYKINSNSSLQLGNFFMPFGAKILGLSYKFIEDASADYAITPSRKVGFSYSYTSDPLNITAGLFSDGSVDNRELNAGYSIAAKAIVRPILDEQTVLHIGVAPLFTKPNGGSASYSSIMPTPLETNTLASGTFDAKNVFRFEGEAIFITGKFYSEAHYLLASNHLEEGGDNVNVNGVYGQVGFILIGDKQNYNKKTGLASPASAKNLEVLARVSHVDIDDSKQTDFTVGLNYFFNKNLNVKLNYVHAIEDSGDKINHDYMHARLQFSF